MSRWPSSGARSARCLSLTSSSGQALLVQSGLLILQPERSSLTRHPPCRRSSETEKRKRFVRLVDDVRDRGGEALIFSSMHESGQRASDAGSHSSASTLLTRLTALSSLNE
jgi:hypothetical protein